MSDFNAGLEAAYRKCVNLWDTACRDCEAVNGNKDSAAHAKAFVEAAEAILALRRPDAPDAVREALTEIAERCEQAAHPGAPVCLTELHVDHLKQIAGRARQALGGER